MTQLELYYQKNNFLFIHHKYNHIVQNDWLVKYEKILIINKSPLSKLVSRPKYNDTYKKTTNKSHPSLPPIPQKKLINKKMKNIFETNVRNRD